MAALKGSLVLLEITWELLEVNLRLFTWVLWEVPIGLWSIVWSFGRSLSLMEVTMALMEITEDPKEITWGLKQDTEQLL